MATDVVDVLVAIVIASVTAVLAVAAVAVVAVALALAVAVVVVLVVVVTEVAAALAVAAVADYSREITSSSRQLPTCPYVLPPSSLPLPSSDQSLKFICIESRWWILFL